MIKSKKIQRALPNEQYFAGDQTPLSVSGILSVKLLFVILGEKKNGKENGWHCNHGFFGAMNVKTGYP